MNRTLIVVGCICLVAGLGFALVTPEKEAGLLRVAEERVAKAKKWRDSFDTLKLGPAEIINVTSLSNASEDLIAAYSARSAARENLSKAEGHAMLIAGFGLLAFVGFMWAARTPSSPPAS